MTLVMGGRLRIVEGSEGDSRNVFRWLKIRDEFAQHLLPAKSRIGRPCSQMRPASSKKARKAVRNARASIEHCE